MWVDVQQQRDSRSVLCRIMNLLPARNYVTHVNEGTDILARKFCITTSDLCIYIIKEYILICIERDIFRILRKKMRFTFF